MRKAAAGAHKSAACKAADAIKRASSSGSDMINKILAGNPQVQASDQFALLENRKITGKPRARSPGSLGGFWPVADPIEGLSRRPARAVAPPLWSGYLANGGPLEDAREMPAHDAAP
jgi:hypothetical protein